MIQNSDTENRSIRLNPVVPIHKFGFSKSDMAFSMMQI